MIRRWIAAHRSLVVTATSSTVVAALVATIAVVSGGYEAQRFDLDDGSVWVANGSQQVIGRANTEVLALDTVVRSDGSELEVVQDGSTLLLLDRTNSTLALIDDARAEDSETVPLPPDAPEVFIAGDNAVIHTSRTGEVWVVPLAELGDFDAESEPTRSFGADTVASVSPTGVLFVYSADAAEVYRLDAAGDGAVSAAPARFGADGDDVAVSSIGDRWTLLNRDDATLSIEGRIVDLSEQIPDASQAVLQQPAEEGDRILISSPGALVVTTVAGAAPRRLVAGDAGGVELGGVAARPVVADGCVFAAWSTGVAWRDCGGAAEAMPLEAVPAAAARLGFARSGDRVVLTDPRGGDSWAVQAEGERIANWDELIDEEQAEQEVEENDLDTPPEVEEEQQSPIAVDDEFGARPGRASVLPVLLNDYDPNGDVLVVSDVPPLDDSVGRLDVVGDGQQLQLTLAPTATGRVEFPYSVDDGRGGTATATVRVAVRSPEENGAPAQARQSRASVAPGGRVTTSVLGDWVDPDGDAFYLTSATVGVPDTVSFKPSGSVVFQEGGGSAELRSVSLVVGDGRADGVGGLAVTVPRPDAVPLVAEAFPVPAYAGQEVTISPLEHVRGGSGTIRLTSVPSKPGSVIETSLETGTFRFTSDQVRTHLLEYIVNDGDQTATGIVRIDVQAPPDANSTPITIPKTIFVRTRSTETIDIASSDIDPAGGVLLLTSVDDVGAASGIRTEVIEQRAVRVTLVAPLPAPVTFGYRVSNGLAEADGSVTVVEIPPPTRPQPPVANDDTVTVRVGDAIDIPVLANDEQPDGEELTLSPDLVTGLSRSSGLLFASGDVLRYLAPQRTGNFTAVYQVLAPDGQFDDAQVTIAVREVVAATNAAPVPAPVVARVLAGETVQVRIPLNAIDPDGDSVQLLGQETGPELGTVTDVGPDYLEYLAGDYSLGTDTFTYTVIDSLGARATGTVRIGIAARTGAARNPVAVPDEVRIRPGKTVSVQALANDSDPDGGVLSIIDVQPNSPDITAEIVGDDVVDVTPPSVPGLYGLVYTVQNAFGGTDSDFITVIVQVDAPPSYPVASDTVLTLSDILDRDEIAVDVLRNVFFADGDVRSLGVAVLPGFGENARVGPGKRITVEITERRQIIPFQVTNPDDPDVVSYAFIRVPGLADALPQLDRTARTPTVVSESAITIDLDDYVISVGGDGVRLVDSTSVAATHANGDPLVVDANTLRYTSADTYFGPASISFEVTDGRSADDPEGRRATIVLPIIVTPRENQPPVFTGGVVDFEPGEQKTLDLLRLTTYNNPEDIDELRFQALSTPPVGFDYTITGTTLAIRADEQTPKGARAVLTIGVRDSVSEGQPGRIDLGVVSSTRPLARPAADSVIAPRGQTTVIDVLANDEATNPFPGRRLRVIDIRGLDSSSLPQGVSISPSADNSRLSVTVSGSAAPGDTTLQYQVADATGDIERYSFGLVRISVQDRPDAPVAPARAEGGYEEGLLTLRLTAPISNNSPITGYTVTSSSHGDYRRDCGLSLRCALTDLVPGLRYQFSVVATNSVGASDPSPSSGELSADYLPAAPATVTARATAANPSGAALDISWSAVPDPNPGTPVSRYVVRVSGGAGDFTLSASPNTTSLSTEDSRLVPNAQYVVTVYARNGAAVLSDADWRRSSSAPVTTVGPPGQTPGLTATSVGSGAISVSWGASDPNGAPTVAYRVLRISAGGSVPSCSNGGGVAASSPYSDGSGVDGSQYQYVVYADNGYFCTPTVSQPVESKTAPGQASAAPDVVGQSNGRFDILVSGLTVATGRADRYEVEVGGAGWRPVANGQWLTSANDGSVYGNPQSLRFRGCRGAVAEALCGPATAATVLTPVNTRAVAINRCSYGLAVEAVAPVNAGAPTVTYLYDFNYDGGGLVRGFRDAYSAAPEAPAGPVIELDTPRVRVKSTVTVDGRSYTDPGWVEGACGE